MSRQVLFWRENQFSLSAVVRRFRRNFDNMGRKYDRNVPLQFRINGTAGKIYLLQGQSLSIDEELNEEFEVSFRTDFIAENMDVTAEGLRS